jgi:hypothetical protein
MQITRSLTEELRPSEENIREADRCTKSLRPILIEPRHLPVEKIADELTKRKGATPRGGRWHGRTVARLPDRLHPAIITWPHWSMGAFWAARCYGYVSSSPPLASADYG